MECPVFFSQNIVEGVLGILLAGLVVYVALLPVYFLRYTWEEIVSILFACGIAYVCLLAVYYVRVAGLIVYITLLAVYFVRVAGYSRNSFSRVVWQFYVVFFWRMFIAKILHNFERTGIHQFFIIPSFIFGVIRVALKVNIGHFTIRKED
ncbi:hypothetical protein HPB52_010179 [Rhipicephalus sanguineus]|uniref:Uncharacterized protein n=1 Tax=Rhipicephalus sanguineus TaxID=34632 RepID=A0A9D4PIZ1_RHISA|nr:hypothetical protein HPB52_010179 [Rhipicephalus sanguineus]